MSVFLLETVYQGNMNFLVVILDLSAEIFSEDSPCQSVSSIKFTWSLGHVKDLNKFKI